MEGVASVMVSHRFNTHFYSKRNAKKNGKRKKKNDEIWLSPKMYGGQSEMVFRDFFRDRESP